VELDFLSLDGSPFYHFAQRMGRLNRLIILVKLTFIEEKQIRKMVTI
jgi:hypothetical protein